MLEKIRQYLWARKMRRSTEREIEALALVEKLRAELTQERAARAELRNSYCALKDDHDEVVRRWGPIVYAATRDWSAVGESEGQETGGAAKAAWTPAVRESRTLAPLQAGRG